MQFRCQEYRFYTKENEMGRDSGSLIGGKRSRPADDEAYFDNFHNHKRYLTEVRNLLLLFCSNFKDPARSYGKK